MPNRAKRVSHIDPPASSYAIMRRASPYRRENSEPGITESLTPNPELENSLDPKETWGRFDSSGERLHRTARTGKSIGKNRKVSINGE